MSSLCYKCEKEIDEETDDYAECDNCDSYFHAKCGNVLKKELNVRKNSKCLQLYCPDCFESKSNGTEDKLKQIIKLLYKLDLFNQEQKAATTSKNQISSIESKLDQLNNTMKNNSQCYSGKVCSQNSSYADMVKRPAVKPTVVVKPKSKQNCAKTFKDIEQNVNKAEVKVCGTRNVREGGIVLRCENVNETMKVKQIINEKLGENYEVVLPKVKCPRLRISNIDDSTPNESIIAELKTHNESIQNIDMRLVTVIPRKKKANSTKEVVVEVQSDSYQRILDLGVLTLPWRECKITEHLHVNRCYKCCGFFHKSTNCKHDQKCSQCGGNHKHTECKAKKLTCVNCKNANEKYGSKMDCRHHAWSKDCTVLLRHVATLKSKIEYNPAE